MLCCTTCDRDGAAVPLEPVDDETARCPVCRGEQEVRRRPVFVVTGASGAGKTTVVPLLAAALPECVVFDVDVLLDALGHGDWPRLRHAWLSVAHAVAQGGRSTVLCGPLIPGHLRDLPSRRWVGDVHFAALDCPDDVLRRRLEARPSWRDSRCHVDEQVGFARWLRANITPTIPTASRTPAAVATDLATWITSLTHPPPP